jgi:hypothetical protein
MKKIISIISLVTMCIVMQGQTIKPAEQYFNDQNNIYFKDVNNHYNKFLGEWEATDGLHYVKIKITKSVKVEQGVTSTGKRMMKIKRYFDMIHIDYLYKYNGNIVYNATKPYQIINGNVFSSEIFGHLLENNNQTLEMFYNEITFSCGRNKVGNLNLTFLNPTNPQLQWIRTEKLSQALETLCPENQVDTSPYKIPSNLTFTKL